MRTYMLWMADRPEPEYVTVDSARAVRLLKGWGSQFPGKSPASALLRLMTVRNKKSRRLPSEVLAGSGLKKLYVTIEEAMAMTSLCRTTLYKLDDEGTIEMVKVGGRTLIKVDSLEGLGEPSRRRKRQSRGT